jgi:hypothetical protein
MMPAERVELPTHALRIELNYLRSIKISHLRRLPCAKRISIVSKRTSAHPGVAQIWHTGIWTTSSINISTDRSATLNLAQSIQPGQNRVENYCGNSRLNVNSLLIRTGNSNTTTGNLHALLCIQSF